MHTTTDHFGPTTTHTGDSPALRPLVLFASTALPSGLILLGIPVILDLPVAPFVLATLAVGLVLPTILLTRQDPDASVRALLQDCTRLTRRSAALLVPALVTIPGLTWVVATAAGRGRDLDNGDLVAALVDVGSSVLIINLWEEMAWQGFFQRRVSARWGYALGALATAGMFVGVHLALGFAGADDASDVGRGMLALVVSGIGLRLLLGALDTWSGRSILVVAVAHASFNVAADFVTSESDWIRYVVTLLLGAGALGTMTLRKREAVL